MLTHESMHMLALLHIINVDTRMYARGFSVVIYHCVSPLHITPRIAPHMSTSRVYEPKCTVSIMYNYYFIDSTFKLSLLLHIQRYSLTLNILLVAKSASLN